VHFWVLAAGSSGGNGVTLGGDWGFILTILNTGLVGIGLVCLVLKKFIVPAWALREKEKECDELKAANASLRTLTEQQIIPALVRANQLSADYAQDLADERRRRHRGEQE